MSLLLTLIQETEKQVPTENLFVLGGLVVVAALLIMVVMKKRRGGGD
jgi:hypothetical protein